MSTPERASHVILRFNRQLTKEEIEQLKSNTDAVEAIETEADADHDHVHAPE